MTRTAARNRGEILRQVSATADARRDGVLPLDVQGVTDAFHDELDLLGALQLRWHSRISGRIERELASEPLDLEQAVVTAWAATAHEHPGVRAILDRYREHPLDQRMADAVRVATAKEHTMLAVMAGRAGLSDPEAARIGAAIEAKARALPAPESRPGGAPGPGLLARLLAALAA